MSGFITLNRSIMNWEWYTDLKTKSLFIHCILQANHDPGTWRGIEIERGSFITSFKRLSKETGLTIKEIRTALKHLESTGELAHKGAQSYSVIIVNKYDYYQQIKPKEGTDKDIQRAYKGHAKGTQRASNNKNNNENNENNDTTKNIYGVLNNVKLTDDEYRKIQGAGLTDYIDQLSEYMESKGKTYKSHYATILSWSRNRKEEGGKQFNNPKSTNSFLDLLKKEEGQNAKN